MSSIKLTIERPFLICGSILVLAAIAGGIYGVTGVVISAIAGSLVSFIIIKQKKIICLSVVLLMIYTVNFIALDAKISKTERFCDSDVNLLLMAIDSPENKGPYSQISVKPCDSGKFPDSQKFTLYTYDTIPVQMGDVFTARVKVLPLDETNYKLSSYSKGTYFKMKLIKFGEKRDEDKFYKLLRNIRVTLQDKLFSNISYDSAATVCAITYGDKNFLDEDFEDNVRNSGVSHVMVVSGMHLSIIMSAVFKVFGRIFYNRFARALSSAVFVFMICGVCGFTVSVTRAAIMYFIAAAAPLFYRENDSVNSLCATVSLILLMSPFAVYNISFQLSVLATFAIVGPSAFYCEMIFSRCSKIKTHFSALIQLVFNTLFAMLFTMPITIWKFGTLSFISPITNLAISYPITFLLELTLLSVLLSFIPLILIICTFMFKISDFVAGYINSAINFFGKMHYSAITVPAWVALPFLAVAFILTIATYYIEPYKQDKLLKEE